MLRNHFEYANRVQGVPLAELAGVAHAFQGNFDPKRIHVINPDDGRPLRLARPNEEPAMLGQFSTSEGRWKYYKDAVVTYRHPHHSGNRNLVGLYVPANMDLADMFDLQAREEGAEFLQRRRAQIKADAARDEQNKAIGQDTSKMADEDNKVVPLFPS